MKKLLVVVDYQNDFVTGSLGFEKSVFLEQNIVNKIKEYKLNGDDVIFTFDTHGDDYAQTQEGINLPIPHCLKQTEGWKLYGSVAALCNDATPCFEKTTFGSLALANYLVEKQYDSVELIGVVSNICVLSNAVLAKAALPEAIVVVDASCTACADETMNEKALDVMEGMQISVINR